MYKLAKLRWFDSLRGEGVVRLNETGESIYLHFTAIRGISKHNHQWPNDSDQILLSNLKTGDECKVFINENLYSKQIEFCDFDLTTIKGE